MGNTVVPGPITVVMHESGNGKNGDCGPPKFYVEGAKNDNRLLGMFGQARVHDKLDSLVCSLRSVSFLCSAATHNILSPHPCVPVR